MTTLSVSGQDYTARQIYAQAESEYDIGRIEQNPDKLQAIYQLGRQTCLAQLDQIKEYIKASEA